MGFFLSFFLSLLVCLVLVWGLSCFGVAGVFFGLGGSRRLSLWVGARMGGGVFLCFRRINDIWKIKNFAQQSSSGYVQFIDRLPHCCSYQLPVNALNT